MLLSASRSTSYQGKPRACSMPCKALGVASPAARGAAFGSAHVFIEWVMHVRSAAFLNLANQLKKRRSDILQRWRAAVHDDSELTTGNALPRAELNDHVPAALLAFEQQLASFGRGDNDPETCVSDGTIEAAAAHGTHRWQQGYRLQEVVRELGHLNLIVMAEMDAFGMQESVDAEVMSAARQAWCSAYAAGIEQSTSRFFALQQLEAAGHVQDLEEAVAELGEIEQQRANLWQQLAHDLRGNVGVVAAATRALTTRNQTGEPQARFALMLERNVDSLRHLLDDVTSLTRLQAGQEHRQVAEFDVSALLGQLCEGLQALANQRGLYLRHAGPAEAMVVEGDAVKVRRLAQNLIINALKYTESGGVEVSWGLCTNDDARRWVLTVRDTGPGIQAGPGSPLVTALQNATDVAHDNTSPSAPRNTRPPHQSHGEGIGLSIVKRLAELLDATVEVESAADVGTRFRIILPRRYD